MVITLVDGSSIEADRIMETVTPSSPNVSKLFIEVDKSYDTSKLATKFTDENCATITAKRSDGVEKVYSDYTLESFTNDFSDSLDCCRVTFKKSLSE